MTLTWRHTWTVLSRRLLRPETEHRRLSHGRPVIHPTLVSNHRYSARRQCQIKNHSPSGATAYPKHSHALLASSTMFPSTYSLIPGFPPPCPNPNALNLQVQPRECGLVLSEPMFNFPQLQAVTEQVSHGSGFQYPTLIDTLERASGVLPGQEPECIKRAMASDTAPGRECVHREVVIWHLRSSGGHTAWKRTVRFCPSVFDNPLWIDAPDCCVLKCKGRKAPRRSAL